MMTNDYSILFEDFGYRDSEYDVLDESIRPVTESMEYQKMKEKEIWFAIFRFNNKENEEDTKPVVVINDPDFGLICVRISTIHNKEGKIARRRYARIIYEWKECGLKEPSFAQCSAIRHIENVTPINKLGVMTDREFERCVYMVNAFKETRYTSIETLVDWFKFVEIKQKPISNKILQTMDDIAKTHIADSIDISIAVHDICKKYMIPHKLVLINLLDDGDVAFRELRCIYKRKGQWRFVSMSKRYSDNLGIEISRTTYSDFNECVADAVKEAKDNDFASEYRLLTDSEADNLTKSAKEHRSWKNAFRSES